MNRLGTVVASDEDTLRPGSQVMATIRAVDARRTVAVYVDGFALYKGLLQRTYPEYKWLDVASLCQRLFPHRAVVQVKFFSAKLKPLTNDPGVRTRQMAFWRALGTTEVEIIEGSFSYVKQHLPLHPEQLDESGRVRTVQVKRPEEKGTDVALATHLLMDAVDRVADSYAIITNDSDLVPPVKMLTSRGHSVALVSVAGPRYNKAFDHVGLETIRQIRRGTLRASQFPNSLVDSDGRRFHKPASWP